MESAIGTAIALLLSVPLLIGIQEIVAKIKSVVKARERQRAEQVVEPCTGGPPMPQEQEPSEAAKVLGTDEHIGPEIYDSPHLCIFMKLDADCDVPSRVEVDQMKASLRAQIGPNCPPIIIAQGMSMQLLSGVHSISGS